ncbi:hypothetical protein CYLTODRAFT_320901, partial [Cylindrobasidium torrendii FP15055 ss-10]
MSESPPENTTDVAEKQLDELDENPQEAADGEAAGPEEPETTEQPVKRGRGRPKGSKNSPKKAEIASDTPKRPRGRPPKPKPEGEVSTPKRPRGRPPKHPRPAA